MAQTNNLNAMLIAGESGLSENMSFRTDLISNPIMERMSRTLESNTEKAKAITANINKATEKVDDKTGEIVKDITDNKIRNVVYRLAAGFKSMFAASGGEGEDVIMGEYQQVETATNNLLDDKKDFQQNRDGNNYSACSSVRTYDANESVHGGNYIGEPVYNSQTNQMMFLVPIPQGDYGNTTEQLNADYNSYVDEMKSMQEDFNKSERIRIAKENKKRIMRGQEPIPLAEIIANQEATPLDEGILTKDQWLLQQQGVDSGDNETELQAGRDGYMWVDLDYLNKDVVLKDAELMTAFEEGFDDIYNTGSSNKNVKRNSNGDVAIDGIDLNELTNNKETLITMAWDNYAKDGGTTFYEDFADKNPDANRNWMKVDHPDFDQKRLKEEVMKFYQNKINKKYESGVADYKNTTQGGIKVEQIDNMVDNAFKTVITSTEGEGETDTVVDFSMLRTDRKKVDLSDDGGMYEVLSWENGDWVVMEEFPKDTDPDILKKYFKVAFGGSLN